MRLRNALRIRLCLLGEKSDGVALSPLVGMSVSEMEGEEVVLVETWRSLSPQLPFQQPAVPVVLQAKEGCSSADRSPAKWAWARMTLRSARR